MKLFQTLEEKKRHAQQILADELESFKYYQTHKSHLDYIGSEFKTNLDDTELKIEALQDFIQNIDDLLREGEDHDKEMSVTFTTISKKERNELLESEIRNDWVNENAPDEEE
jgi:glutaredoxin 2